MTSDSSKAIDVKLQAIFQSAKENKLWVHKLNFLDEPYIYFAYTDSKLGASLIFSVDDSIVFERFTDRLNRQTLYEIYDGNQLLHKSQENFLTLESKVDDRNYLTRRQDLEGTDLEYVFSMDISRK